jgi:hypothetical protein
VVAVAVVTLEIHVFVLLFRRNRLSVFLTHGWEARRRLAEKSERRARRWESGGKAQPVTNAHYRLACSCAPNGRRRPVQRTFAVRWAVHPRARSGIRNNLLRIQQPRQGRFWQVVTNVVLLSDFNLSGNE